MFHFNIDFAVECIKNICENTKCPTCDKLIGPCARFTCGHSICIACAEKSEECLFCISSPTYYQLDKPQTERVKNASALLNIFQDTFKTDVYRRKRISDQLKLEKLLFPECIQAPLKYCNKRKTFENSFENKENFHPTFFPGEKIIETDKITMKKSFLYVQNWLNQHEDISENVRKPFRNINVNTPALPKNYKKQAKNYGYRKKSHTKSICNTSSLLNTVVEQSPGNKNLKFSKEVGSYEGNLPQSTDINESGIVVDDEAILIENTNHIDKDKQAWLAVLEQADQEESRGALYLNKSFEKQTNVDDMLSTLYCDKKRDCEKIEKNVLFYKRSALSGKCNLCHSNLKHDISSSTKIESHDVSIVITNSSFITTIQLKKCEENQNEKCNKSSVAIQTNEDTMLHKQGIVSKDKNVILQKRQTALHEDDTQNKRSRTSIDSDIDIFVTEYTKGTQKEIQNLRKGNSFDNVAKPQKCLVIEDSDTDSNISCGNTQEVKVEVHNVESGVLKMLSKREYQQRLKRQARGHTPNSSNSSEKENLDPNRNKVTKLGKKYKKKK